MCIHYNPADPVWVESQEISVKDQKNLSVRKLITVIAEVQPQLIQGIRRGDGVGDLFIYLFIQRYKE